MNQPNVSRQPKVVDGCCWQCQKPLDPEGLPFFCDKDCSSKWAMTQAYALNQVRVRMRQGKEPR